MREDKQHLLSNRNSINVQLACQSQRQRLGLKLDLSTDEVQGVVFQVEVPGWGEESGSGTSETCDGLVNQTEGDLTSDKVEGAAVRACMDSRSLHVIHHVIPKWVEVKPRDYLMR